MNNSLIKVDCNKYNDIYFNFASQAAKPSAHLSLDEWFEVFDYLETDELMQCSLSCKSFKDLIREKSKLLLSKIDGAWEAYQAHKGFEIPSYETSDFVEFKNNRIELKNLHELNFRINAVLEKRQKTKLSYLRLKKIFSNDDPIMNLFGGSWNFKKLPVLKIEHNMDESNLASYMSSPIMRGVLDGERIFLIYKAKVNGCEYQSQQIYVHYTPHDYSSTYPMWVIGMTPIIEVESDYRNGALVTQGQIRCQKSYDLLKELFNSGKCSYTDNRDDELREIRLASIEEDKVPIREVMYKNIADQQKHGNTMSFFGFKNLQKRLKDNIWLEPNEQEERDRKSIWQNKPRHIYINGL